jgi:hypothetical protein
MPTTITMTGPGTTTLVDDAAAAIIAQNVILLQIKNISANNANVMVDLKKEISALGDACNTLKVSIGSIATMSAGTNAIIAMQASNQIKTNNYQIEATKAALERTNQPPVVMPTIQEQMTESVRESAVLMQIGQAEGFVTNQINTLVSTFTTWIGTFLPSFSDVTGWIKRKYAAVMQPNPPSNAQDALTKVNNSAGNIDTSNLA